MTTKVGAARGTRGSLLVRSVYGSPAVESFVIIAIVTILITRLYLWITDYPQVGSGSLHIAHALYGGALMTVALVVGWLMIGFAARVTAIVAGGIGLGLFLDEIGKFVTKTNDYFYGPSAEIMYICLVVVLVAARLIRDFRHPSVTESLANAAAIAAEGVAHGLPDARRQWAVEFLDRATEQGADPRATAGIRATLDACPPSSDRLRRLRLRVPSLVPGFLRSPRWVSVMGWLMVVTSIVTVVSGALGMFVDGITTARDSVELVFTPPTISNLILFGSGCVTVALALPSLLARCRTTALWPLRFLRAAALIFTTFNALVDFAQQGFGALASLAVGLFTLAVISHHLAVATRERAAVSTDELRI
ncbi:hypothetical protein [Williamsia phyllosphaerae]|uniref:Uncharacterized protein n=1 Tax=Williamsia phyllosphaerae TaxID=885042 RepID=A0ABQ1V380_9NOCA|nr:hypothetical protein [Williamsia phyllosphaerae]GGF36633.1 hypothetical protein GCM10007298_35440 [Williamsia phyllosphaerae]